MPPADLLAPELAGALLVSFLGGLMRGFSGFGNALMMAPVLAVLYAPAVAVPVVLIVELALAAQLVPGAVRDVHWPELGAIGAPACLAAPFGGYLLAVLDAGVVKLVIAVVVAVFAGLMLMGWRYRGRRAPGASALVGLTSGLLIGVTSIAGPPVILYLLAGADPARYNRATLIVYFGLVTLATYPMLWVNGLLNAHTLWLSVIVAPLVVIGARLGTRLFRVASEAVYRRIALVFLLSIALFAMLA